MSSVSRPAGCVQITYHPPMNSFSNAFRAEVVRMARKELKPELQSMRKAITNHRSEIAALKREVKSLASQLKAAKRQPPVAEETPPVAKKAIAQGSKAEFHPEVVRQMRAALGITQAQMAQLLGASQLSVSRWESGKARPRAAQLARIDDLRSMGPKNARRKLGHA